MSKVLGILDSDIRYSERLMEYLKRRKRMIVQVRVFSDLDNMNIFLEHNRLDVLLLGENLYPLQGGDYSNIQIVVLLEEHVNKKECNYKSIHKYQSVGNLIIELMDICPELKESEESNEAENDLEIIVTYSLGSTGIGEVLSYLLAKEYANMNGVLFMNLEPFSGLSEIIAKDNQKGMSEVIYYVNEKAENLKDKLELIIKHKDSIDMISDITFSTDLYDLTTEGMRILLNTIRTCKKYKFCVINAGFVSSAVIELLVQCTRLYIVSGEEDIIYKRKESFIKQLKWAGYEAVINKMELILLKQEEQKLILRNYEEGIDSQGTKEYMSKFIK